MSNLSEADINSIYDAVVSHAMTLGRFPSVNQHEPKGAPTEGPHCAIWVDWLGPMPTGSGGAATTALLILNERIYMNFRQDPLDMIDPSIIAAVNDLIGAYSGDFDLNCNKVRCIDLLGMSGTMLHAQAGYLELDHKIQRIMTITLPIIIDDAWAQAA